jgi:hypothetical protein
MHGFCAEVQLQPESGHRGTLSRLAIVTLAALMTVALIIAWPTMPVGGGANRTTLVGTFVAVAISDSDIGPGYGGITVLVGCFCWLRRRIACQAVTAAKRYWSNPIGVHWSIRLRLRPERRQCHQLVPVADALKPTLSQEESLLNLQLSQEVLDHQSL